MYREVHMGLQSLLVSSDAKVLGVLPDALRHAGLGVDVYRRAESVMPRLKDQEMSCLILDSEQQVGASEILKSVQELARHKHVVTVAIDGHSPSRSGSAPLSTTLTMHKPLSREVLSS